MLEFLLDWFAVAVLLALASLPVVFIAVAIFVLARAKLRGEKITEE